MSRSYDLAGRIVSLSDTAGHALTNAYDSAGRIVSTAATIPGLAARTVAYAYDAASNRTRLSWPDGYSVSYGGACPPAARRADRGDAANRMLSALENGTTALAAFDGACPPAARRADRGDNLGRPFRLALPRRKAGVAGRNDGFYGAGAAANDVSLSWSGEGDLLTLAHALSGTAYNVSFTDSYTPAHQIASSGVSNGLYQYVPTVTGTDAYAPDALKCRRLKWRARSKLLRLPHLPVPPPESPVP